MNQIQICCTLILCLCLTQSPAQELKPGFSKEEYVALMNVSAQFGDSGYAIRFQPPAGYRLAYRSPVMGLDNRWDLWQAPNGLPVISIRGTTMAEISWLANFYAAMVPAKGEIKLSESEVFSYTLAEHPRAAVHVGWLISTAFLAKDMLPKIDSFYRAGRKEFFVIGHSQGGAIAYLLTAYLLQLQNGGRLPADLRFKTYASAGPKPGNQYFAYEYEAATQAGWAYNVVNAADWVPQTPFSVQTMDDMAAVNPFVNAAAFIKKMGWPKRWAVNYAFGRLRKPSQKARKNYKKFLGGYAAKSIRKALPGFEEPAYFNSSDYVRAGTIITLLPQPDYYQKFPEDKTRIFQHHFHDAYLYLTNKLSLDKTAATSITGLQGTWELAAMPGENIGSLFTNRKPALRFDNDNGRFGGHTGCNSFNGTAQADGKNTRFPESFAMTKMACPGEGEQRFLNALKEANHYRVNGTTLTLMNSEKTVMQLIKK